MFKIQVIISVVHFKEGDSSVVLVKEERCGTLLFVKPWCSFRPVFLSIFRFDTKIHTHFKGQRNVLSTPCVAYPFWPSCQLFSLPNFRPTLLENHSFDWELLISV